MKPLRLMERVIQLTIPIFKHDCDECHYIKTAEYQGRTVDFYVCGNKDTVIYRDGNEPPMNGSVCFANRDQAFIDAYSELYNILQMGKENISMRELELLLLQMWADNRVEEVYKYKNRINWYRREDLPGIELFHDLTYRLFQDVEDIANYKHSIPEEYKVSVKKLIEDRK